MATGTSRAPAGTPTASSPGSLIVPARLDQPFVLKIGQVGDVQPASLRVTLTTLLEDSRCPRSVFCALAGRARMAFTVDHADRLARFDLSTGPLEAGTRGFFHGYVLEMIAVDPYPQSPEQPILLDAYRVTVVVRTGAPPATAGVNQPFVLKIGQTARIENENVQLTFEGVKQDSRCPVLVTCVTRGNAVVEVTLKETVGSAQTFVLNTDETTQNRRIPDIGKYTVQLLALTPYPRGAFADSEIAPAEYEATLMLREFAPVPQVTPRVPPPRSEIKCPPFTREVAEAILGQAVRPSASASIIISAGFQDDLNRPEPEGICGWLSVAANDQIPAAGEPRITGPERAAFAVGARSLTGAGTLELVRVAHIVRAAAPDIDLNPLYILQVGLTAGDWDTTLDRLEVLARSTGGKVTAERLDKAGTRALWLWRPAQLANYATLVVRTSNGFMLVEALADKQLTAPALKESLLPLALAVSQ